MDDRYLSFCKQALAIMSVSGQEGDFARWLMTSMDQYGFDSARMDAYGNVIGTIKGSGNGPVVVMEGHMDTVGIPHPDSWKHDPSIPMVDDEKLFGRGAADMKCALCAMVFGIGELVAAGWRPSGDLHVVGVVYEEIFEGIAFGKVLDEIAADMVILGEATGLKVFNGQKGRAEVCVETFGKNAHSANPEQGVNAADSLVRLLSEISYLTPVHDDLVGDGLLVLTDIASEPYPGKSVIPHYAKATFDRRLIVGETEYDVLAPIEAIIDALFQEDSSFEACASIAEDKQLCITGRSLGGKRFFPAWWLEPDHRLVREAMAAVTQVLDAPAQLDTYYFCTDGSESAGRRNIPTIGIGPSLQRLAHVTDEYVPLEQLEQVKDIYKALLERLYS